MLSDEYFKQLREDLEARKDVKEGYKEACRKKLQEIEDTLKEAEQDALILGKWIVGKSPIFNWRKIKSDNP